jgi:hypothetical protein
MTISSQIVWLAGIFIEFVILVRAIQCKSFGKYSLFYTYVASVLGASAFLYGAPKPLYNTLYWPLDFVTMVLGCGVIVEISRHVFAQHTSLERFARWTAITVFGAMFLVFAIHSFLFPHWKPAANPADLARDLRIVEAIALLTIVFLTGYYGIEIGKNMKGMILGFGVYVGTSIITLTLRLFIGIRFSPIWKITEPSSFVAALIIWAVALWSYAPVPVVPAPPPDTDYEGLAGRTRQGLGSIQEHLSRTSRP